jgi:hypothetical protein
LFAAVFILVDAFGVDLVFALLVEGIFDFDFSTSGRVENRWLWDSDDGEG